MDSLYEDANDPGTPHSLSLKVKLLIRYKRSAQIVDPDEGWSTWMARRKVSALHPDGMNGSEISIRSDSMNSGRRGKTESIVVAPSKCSYCTNQ